MEPDDQDANRHHRQGTDDGDTGDDYGKPKPAKKISSSSSPSSLMPTWLVGKGRQAKRLAGFKEAGGVFDKLKYWRLFEHNGRHFFTAPSRVKELLPIKGRRYVVVVCYNGELIVVEINTTATASTSSSSPRVDWAGRVARQLPADERTPVQLRHAAYDSLHGAVFFTVGFNDGVFYAILTEMEIEARANKLTRLTPFIQPSSSQNQQLPLTIYHGLAVDSENSVVYVCNNDCVTAWSSSKLDQPKKLQEIRFDTPGIAAPLLRPYKVAVYLDVRGSSKLLMAVADRSNSTLTQLQVKYSRSSLGLGVTNGVQFDVISTLATGGSSSRLGVLSEPQCVHFDPAGNLLVADDKNGRIQVFPFAQDGATALDAADHQLVIGAAGLLAHLKTVAVVTTPDDEPIILAGMSGPFGNFGAKNILRLSYKKEQPTIIAEPS